MTLINQNSISGINSITAESNTINFYDVVGNKLNINCGVTVATGATIGGSTNTITASTNGSERVRIDSTGNVGIGTDNPASLLHLQGSAPRITFTDTAGTDDIGKIFSSSGALYLQQRDGSAHGEIIFRTENNSTAVERLRITNTGNVQIANGNLVFSTSGTGIDFSATADSSGTMTSELLDDYEEGTWTPAYDTNTTSSTAITYNNQTGGSYIKIGRAVYICGRVRTNNNQSLDGTGNIVLTGLPFAISDGFDGDVNTQDTYTVISVQQVDGWTEAPLVLLGQAGFSTLDLYNGTTLSEPVVVADFGTGGSGINRMRFSGFYFTDD